MAGNKYTIFKRLTNYRWMTLFILLLILNISKQLGYAQINILHNSERKMSVEQHHTRRSSGVKFSSWVDSLDKHRGAIDRNEIREKLAQFKRIAESSQREPLQPLPELKRCDRSSSRINRQFPAGLSNDVTSKLDLLFYDPEDAQDRTLAEMSFEGAVPYVAEAPSSKSRLGYLLGLECLPTRILLTDKGLEFRTEKAAWKIKSKDKDQRSKIFKKEFKQINNEFRHR